MFSNIKRRVGIISAIAVLAALVPALTVSTASAAVSLTPVKPNSAATYSACPTGSASAAGFTDTTSTDVDCIKMHGITSGVTATTYEPTGSIPRWQMALFLTRFATSAGVTLGSGADQGFTDIGGLSAEIQTAINQIKQLGVTTGTTATTYSPDSNVTREQMAMFVERMLGKTTAGPGGSGATATYSGLVTNATATYNYTDIDGGNVTYEGHNAVVEIYHLGVPGHVATNTTFDPSGDITRADMATWMANALAHTNARPSGVWVQASVPTGFGSETATLHVSHRTSAGSAAAPGTLIDIFSDVATANTSPFTAAGACNTTNTTELGNTSGDECKVDLADTSTDAFGNIGGSTGTTGGSVSTTAVTWYAWTAATGTSYNTSAPANTATKTNGTAATYTKLSNTISLYNADDSSDATYELVRYGTTVTITGQLQTAAGGSNSAVPGVAIAISEHIRTQGDDGAGLDNNTNAEVSTSLVTSGTVTDATGAFTHTISIADPNPLGSAGSTLEDRHLSSTTFVVDLNMDGTPETAAGTVNIAWDDNPSIKNIMSQTQSISNAVGVSDTYGGLARSTSVTAYDQFGVGMAGQLIAFITTATTGSTGVTDAFTDGTRRTTDSTGVATLAFSDVQTATAKVVDTACNDDGTGAGDPNDGACHANETAGQPGATSTFYRLEPAGSAAPDFLENNADVKDGSATVAVDGDNDNEFIGTNTGDIVTFTNDHQLALGDEIVVETAPLTANEATASGTALTQGSIFWAVPVTDQDKQITVANSRTLNALGAYVYNTVDITNDTGANTKGVMERTGSADGIKDAADSFAEVLINDAANDTIVVEIKVAAGNYDYTSYTYDDGDQFSAYADHATNGPLAVSMAAFETHMAARFNATTGAPKAETAGDIFRIFYVNDAEGGGVSVFHMGS